MTDLEKELILLKNSFSILEKRIDKLENDIEKRLKSIEDKYDKLSENIRKGLDDIDKRFDKLEDDSQYAKGFIKAILIFAGLVAFITSVIFNFVK